MDKIELYIFDEKFFRIKTKIYLTEYLIFSEIIDDLNFYYVSLRNNLRRNKF